MLSRRGRAAAPSRRLIVPPVLGPGDLVGVVAPGSAVARDAVEAGAQVLERMGLRVRLGKALFRRHGTFAGDDCARAEDLETMLADEEVRAIHFARGGWGMSRFLETVSWRRLASRPKLLIGYSDLTSLFAPVLDRCGLCTIYGPHVSEIGKRTSYDRPSLERAYFRPRAPLEVTFRRKDVLSPGLASGRAAGGCLTLLAHLAGTPYAPRLSGRILLVEEIAEPPYRIDRLMTQLRLSGMLRGVRGVLIGGLTGCAPAPTAPSSPGAMRVIASHFAGESVPVVGGIRFGHVDRKVSIPLGFRVRLDTRRGKAVFTP